MTQTSPGLKLLRLSCVAALLLGCREAPSSPSESLSPSVATPSTGAVAAGAATPSGTARSDKAPVTLHPAAAASAASLADAAPSVVGSVFAPSPSAAVHTAPSVLGVRLGDSEVSMTKLLGACDAAPKATVCIYWERGLELELAAGHVQRMVAHQAGDKSLLADSDMKERFSRFRQGISGAYIGMTEAIFLNVMGAPTQALVPLGKPADAPPSIWEYAKESLSVEMESVKGNSQVVRIHVPLAPARPAR